MPEWMPIETAPKDVPILIWKLAADEDGMSFGVWPAIITDYDEPDLAGDGDDIGWINVAHYHSAVGYSVENVRATHWMPMPEAPK